MDKLCVDNAHKDACVVEAVRNGRVITACILHHHARFAIERLNECGKLRDVAVGVLDLERREDDLSIRAEDRDHALPL